MSSLLVMINRNFKRKLPGHERRSGRSCPCGVVELIAAASRWVMVTWCGGRCSVWWRWWRGNGDAVMVVAAWGGSGEVIVVVVVVS